jgi:AraC-like DNA-binding protein
MLAGRRAQAWRHQPAYRRPRHFHDEPEINVVLRGWARLGLGRHEVCATAGDLLFFPPGLDHVLLEASDDLDLFVLALSPELADRALGTRVFRSTHGGSLSAPEGERWLEHLAGLSDVRNSDAVERGITSLFGEARAKLPGGHPTSRRALSEVLKEPRLSAVDLSRRLGTAPAELSRRVRCDWGVPFVELRARVKLMHFIGAVDQGRELTQAALEAEFGSYAQCHRVFQRLLGCSPSSYFRGERLVSDGRYEPME